eukprot:TRINITY_DN27878_c0_g1_i7.p1 TRINITY_DN27878_c0_g1~~TRINITY_DN27878_c0_g1_i7.p1  ORF type:complete len:212 (-),score=64.12 TRINITY_DN27878_c0_g1_i7:1218-1796(-)
MYKLQCILVVVCALFVTSEARGLYKHNEDSSDEVEERKQLEHMDPKVLRYLLKEMTSYDSDSSDFDSNPAASSLESLDNAAGVEYDTADFGGAPGGYYLPEYMARGAGYAPAGGRLYLGRGSHAQHQVKRAAWAATAPVMIGAVAPSHYQQHHRAARSSRSLKRREADFLGQKREIRTPEEAYQEWILANLG